MKEYEVTIRLKVHATDEKQAVAEAARGFATGSLHATDVTVTESGPAVFQD